MEEVRFIRMTFPASEVITPQVTEQVTEQVTPQVIPQVTPQVERLLGVFTGEHTRQKLQDFLELSDRKNFRENYLNPAIEAGLVELVDPNNPTSSKQRYVLTTLGMQMAEKINKD